MAAPKISVALPVRNGMPHLQEAIEGLQRQTFRDFELLVQDGLSSDGSLEYLRGLETDFPVHIVSEADGSLVAGYNRAIGRAAGELVVAAACDEVFDADALERYVAWYREQPEALCIYGGSRIRNPDGTTTDFQPLRFRLIDYVRHQMCPTTAGAFNRRLLGAELRLDESLQSVPDFELFTRIALKFGEARIVCKRAMTMTARGDAASMSFRPEAFAQFALDKEKVIGRLMSGPLKERLLEYFRREAMFQMHAQFAEQVYGLAGDVPAFREQVLAAEATMAGQPLLLRIAGRSRHFRVDAEKGTLRLRSNVAPLPPPGGRTKLLGEVALRSEPHWVANGALAEPEPGGVKVRTPAGAWHYAAWAPIGFPLPGAASPGAASPDAASWTWIRVVFGQVKGRPMLALFDPANNVLHGEARLAGEAGEIFFELFDPACTHLLLRNGAADAPSSVLIRRLELLAMPIVPELAA